MKKLYFLSFIIALIANPPISAANETTLSMQEAVMRAIESDPMIAAMAERRRAMQDHAIADGQLPDPSIKIANANIPVTSFNFNQEPMTQLQLGISQQFPRGNTRHLRSERSQARADLTEQKKTARLYATVLETRISWLGVRYWTAAISLMSSQQSALEGLLDITRSHYAEGRGKQQDVLRAQLELNLLKDKLFNASQQLENSRATLARWIGEEAAIRQVDTGFPTLFTDDRNSIQEGLANHPMVGIQDAEIEVSRFNVKLANQAYKPGWGLDVTYGARANDPIGQSRADFVSVMVKFDVPLFTSNRQDRRLSAARRNEVASQLERDDQIRQLEQMLASAWADNEYTKARLSLYETEILADSAETYAVTLNAYRNDVTGFALLIRAQLIEFENQLKALMLTTDQLKAQARLLYLQGEKQ